jgi:hypothetical protein
MSLLFHNRESRLPAVRRDNTNAGLPLEGCPLPAASSAADILSEDDSNCFLQCSVFEISETGLDPYSINQLLDENKPDSVRIIFTMVVKI